MTLPENLINIRVHEERLWNECVALISADPKLSAHTDMLEASMDLLDVFVKRQVGKDDDERTLQHLAIRIFNDLASAWKLISSGYHQVAAMVLRDVVETSNLVNYFSYERAQIEVWRKADHKKLIREFGPGAIRKALAAHQNVPQSELDTIYSKFSRLAGHASLDGFPLLRKDELAVIGPFLTEKHIGSLLVELGQLAAMGAFAFVTSLDLNNEIVKGVGLRFIHATITFLAAFGTKYSDEQSAKIIALFGTPS